MAWDPWLRIKPAEQSDVKASLEEMRWLKDSDLVSSQT